MSNYCYSFAIGFGVGLLLAALCGIRRMIASSMSDNIDA